jgi:hypothetical protein
MTREKQWRNICLSFLVIPTRKQQNNKYKAKEGDEQKKNCTLFLFFFPRIILTKRREKKYALFILLCICIEETLPTRTSNSMHISLN